MKAEKPVKSGRVVARQKSEPVLSFNIFPRSNDRTEPKLNYEFYSLLTPDVLKELGELDESWCEELNRPRKSDSSSDVSIETITTKESLPGDIKTHVEYNCDERKVESSINQEEDNSKCEPPSITETFGCHSTPKSGHPLIFGFSPETPVHTLVQTKATPNRIALSLGATLGDHELSWSSSMATPSSKTLESRRGSPILPNSESSSDETTVVPKVVFDQDLKLQDKEDDIPCGQTSTNESGALGVSLNDFSELGISIMDEITKCPSNPTEEVENEENPTYEIQNEDSFDDHPIPSMLLQPPATSSCTNLEVESGKTENEILLPPPLISDTSTECLTSGEDASRLAMVNRVVTDDTSNLTEKPKDSVEAETKGCDEPLLSDQNVLSADENDSSKLPQIGDTRMHCKMCCSQGKPKVSHESAQDVPCNTAFVVLLNDVPPGMYRVVCNGDVQLGTVSELPFNENALSVDMNCLNENRSDGRDEVRLDNDAGTCATEYDNITKHANLIAEWKKICSTELSSDSLNLKVCNAFDKNFMGFSTAGGKAVKISEAAIHSARRLFEDELTVPELKSSGGGGEMPSNLNDSDSSYHQGGVIEVCGFSTARGQPIHISNEALNNARSLWTDVDTEEFEHEVVPSCLVNEENVCKNSQDVLSFQSFKPVSDNEKELNVGEPTFKEMLPHTSKHLGFSTGAGKIITVSEDALSRARQLFTNCEVDSDINQYASTSCQPHFGGFETASGKKIIVSEEALLKAKETLLSEDDVVPLPSRTETIPKVLENSSANVTSNHVNEVPTNTDAVSCELGTPEHKIPVNRRRLKTNKESKECYGAKEEISKEDWDEMNELFEDEAFIEIPTQPHHSLIDKEATTDFGLNKDVQLSAEIHLSTAALLEDEKEAGGDGCWLATQQSVSTKNKRKGVDLLATPRRSKRLRGKGFQLGVLQRRSESTKLRHERLVKKQNEKITPIMGPLWLKKHQNKDNRLTLRQYVGTSPTRLMPNPLLERGLMKSLLSINSGNAEEYFFLWEEACKFSPTADDGIVPLECGAVLIFNEDDHAGKREFFEALIDTPGVDPKLVSERWVFNHYRWIIWKLSSLEMKFPDIFGGKLLNPNTVMDQLQYRYNCEIDLSRRSAIKKLLEQDDSPTKAMILCVTSILGEEANTSSNNGMLTLELTDGWYKIKAITDERLSKLIRANKIYVGLKLVVFGCEFSSSFDPCDPLEVPSNVCLQLNANCCRRARWDAKLGFLFTSRLSLPISSLFADGGRVASVDILVARVYPMQYLEKKDDGSFLFYNDRTNDRAARLFEATRNAYMEDLTKEVVTEFEEQEDKKRHRMSRRSLSRGNISRERIESLNSGEEISEILETTADPSVVESFLNEYQKMQLIDYKRSVDDKKRVLMEREIQNKAKVVQERNVVPFMKFVAVGLSSADIKSNNYCLVTIWRPSPDLEPVLKEGKKLRVFNLFADNKREERELQLKTSSQTRFVEINDKEITTDIFIPRRLVSFNRICGDFQPVYGVVDIVGVVIKSRLKEQGRFDCVYIMDAVMDTIIIKFWNGLKAFSLEDVLIPETFVLATNLQLRAKTNEPIQSLYATETSGFTQRPRDPHMKMALDELEKLVTQDRQYFEIASQKITQLTKDHPFGRSTPIGTPNLGKPVSSSTPLNRCRSGRNSFGGGSINESPITGASPSVETVSKGADQKIKTLQRYGDPPPLLSLSRANSAQCKKGFKPPLKRK